MQDWLDVPATKGAVWIRYVEFSHFVDGKIAETYTLIDILDLMRQAGCSFIPSLAPEIQIPGPATCNGLQMLNSNAEETAKSFKLVHAMIWVGLESFSDKGLENMRMEKYWHKDFM